MNMAVRNQGKTKTFDINMEFQNEAKSRRQ